MPGVVVVGSFNVDHVWTSERLPRAGETLDGRYASGPGGKGFNQAMASVRSGAVTQFICALGDDGGGRLARELAATEGIDLLAKPSDEPTGTAGILVDAAGRNSIVIGAGANASLDTAFVRTKQDCLSAAAVVLAQCEVPAGAIEAAFAIARANGATTILNPAPANVPVAGPLWALADIATPNETEFAASLHRAHGIEVDADALAGLDDASLDGLCRRLLPHGEVALTLGAAGVFLSRRDGGCARLAAPAVEVVDTTGAGDAFNGALAATLALAPGLPMEAAVLQAVRYASVSTERAGAALAMPRAAMLQGRF